MTEKLFYMITMRGALANDLFDFFCLYLTNETTDRPGRIINPPLLKCLLHLIKRDIECIAPSLFLNESRFITELQAAHESRCHSD